MSMAFNPPGDKYATVGSDPKVFVYDVETKKRVAVLDATSVLRLVLCCAVVVAVVAVVVVVVTYLLRPINRTYFGTTKCAVASNAPPDKLKCRLGRPTGVSS